MFKIIMHLIKHMFNNVRELSGSLVVRTLHFYCRGRGFDPWSGNEDPASQEAEPKKEKN